MQQKQFYTQYANLSCGMYVKAAEGQYLPFWRDRNILNIIMLLICPSAMHCMLHAHDRIPTAYQAVLISFSNPLTPSCHE